MGNDTVQPTETRTVYRVHILLPVEEAQEIWSTNEDTLEGVIHKLRESWQEDEQKDGAFGDQVIAVLVDGRRLALLSRGADPAICHTLYADGRFETHRCRYVIGPLGYERTEISKL